jgi:hypothetical protein
LKTARLDICYKNQLFFFNSFWGLLLYKESESIKSNSSDAKLHGLLTLNNKPYSLAINTKINQNTLNIVSIINIQAKMLTTIAKLSFKLAQYFSYTLPKSFDNATEAIKFYRKNIYPNQQNDLCLPRALFAAATSKKFKQKGVIFIGVFLPSNTMHAWIIEDGAIADPYDGIWLNYQPVAALYYE